MRLYIFTQAQSFSVPFEIEYEHQFLLRGSFSELDWLGKAARLFEMSALLAEEVHDFHRVLDGLTEYAMVLLELEQLKAVSLVIRRIERTQGYDYQEALFATMNRITEGDLHFERGEAEQALERYKVAFADLAKQSGYPTYFLTDRLRDLEKRLRRLEPTESARWCDQLREEWLARSVSSVRPDMLDMLEQTRLAVWGLRWGNKQQRHSQKKV